MMPPLSLYTRHYFDIRPGHSRRRRQEIPWTEALPPDCLEQVTAPLYFDHYLDYQLAAERILGRDEDDEICFCAHSYVLEAPDHTAIYAESLKAWRLRDERWLVYRVVQREGRLDDGRGFYVLAGEMPR